MLHRRLLAPLALIALSAALSSCGDDSAAPDRDPAEEQRIADAALITIDDLAPNWTSGPRDESSSPIDAFLEEELLASPACARFVELDPDPSDGIDLGPDAPIRAESPTYEQGTNDVENTVSMWPTVDEARIPFEIADESDYTSCVADIFPKALTRLAAQDPSQSFGDISVTEVPLDVGDEAYRLDISAEIIAGEQRATLLLTLAAVRVDRLNTSVTISRLHASQLDVDGLVDALAARAQRALAT